jgi:hypothetical protein
VSVEAKGDTAVAAAARPRPKRITIGSARFSDLPASRSSKVTFKLNATGRRLLKAAHGRLKATAAITYTAAGATRSAKALVLIRRPARH